MVVGRFFPWIDMGINRCERMVVAVLNKGVFGKYLNSTDDDFRIFQKP